MSNDPGRTTGETHGTEQEPVEAGERDATQREQAANEHAPAEHDPSTPTQTTQDAGDSTDLGQEEIGEEGGDSEPVVTGG